MRLRLLLLVCLGSSIWLVDGPSWAQPRAAEGAEHLTSPVSRGQAVLETGVALGRPSPTSADARPVVPDARAEPPVEGAAENRVAPDGDTRPGDGSQGHGTELRRSISASPTRARLQVRVSGNLGPVIRSVLATDLAYVPEVSIGLGGRWFLGGIGERANGVARIELTLVDGGGAPVLRRSYEGEEAGLARFLHGFADQAVGTLTGRAGAFQSRLVFARRVAPGRKDVYVADADGGNARRVSSGDGIATLPSFGAQAIWYSIATPRGIFITRTGASEQPIVGGPGMHMGVRECGERLMFASTREGNTDIWTADLDGSNERRLTRHPAIEVSPSCGPAGRIAFVSDRRGRPQIFIMNRDGSGVRQVTHEAGAAQTPSFCTDHGRPRIAFTALGEGSRIAVVDLSSGAIQTVSQPGESPEAPAFSPDCRMLAWTSDRGVVVASSDGRHPRVVANGRAETVRWGR